jgi:uncharacterized protein (TIGR03663 family)
MHTTKETFILSVIALFLSLALDQVIRHKTEPIHKHISQSLKWYHLVIVITLAGIISILFFSSFFTNPEGIRDSMTAYANYFSKAVENDIHRHPWYYYLQVLSWNDGPAWIIWSELPILILSLLGLIRVFIRKNTNEKENFLRIIAIFSVFLFVLYSFIPYKTPWNILTAFFGAVLMAGYGMVYIFSIFPKSWIGATLRIILILTVLYLITQTLFSNYKYSAHSSNPYVYGHTTTDIFYMVHQIHEVSVFHPDGKDMRIQVICSNHDYWPLPWYLRDFNNIGWWDVVDQEVPMAPLVVVSPDLKEALIKKMYTKPKPGEKYLYIPLFDENTWLRPGVKINGYVRRDYWNF